jgi:acyl carrier protein
MQAIIDEIKQLIITTLELEDVRPEDIDPEGPLFGEGLGLDSIDALELGVELQKRYGLRIEEVTQEVRRHFYSVATLARFVADFRTGPGAAQPGGGR